jgi:hypothetical protein
MRRERNTPGDRGSNLISCHSMTHQQWDWSVRQEVSRHTTEKALSQATVRIGAHYDHCRLFGTRTLLEPL